MRKTTFSIALVLGVVLVGCGGSGSGLSAGEPAPSLALSTGAVVLHAMQGATTPETGACTATVYPAADWTAASDQPAWCTVTPAGASGTVLTVSADPTGLPNGANLATVTVSAPGVPDATLNVTLTVHEWTLSQSAVNFLVQEGETLEQTQDITVTTDPPQNWAATDSEATGGNWCAVTPSGSSGGTLTVTGDPTDITAGTYTATVTVSSANMEVATVDVTLVVQSVGISTGVSEFVFRAIEGDTTTQQDSCTVTTDPPQVWDATDLEDKGGNWCTLSFTGVSGTDLTVTVDPTGLTKDTYTSTVTITSTGLPDATVTVRLLIYGPPDWNQMTSPVSGVNLRGIHGTAYDNMFAVGDGGGVLHYDGSAWTQMNHGLTDINLYDVWAVDENNVFAVGCYPDGSGLSTRDILYYDGSSWTLQDSGTDVNEGGDPAVWGASPTDVHAVWCAGHIRYDGTNWTTSDGVGCAYGISGGSSTDIWACGSSGRRDHWDGGTWTFYAGGDIDPATRNLEDVWGLPSGDAFFVGRGRDPDNLNGPFLHYDGTTPWTVYDVLYSGTSQDLRLFGVWAESPTSVWICGERNWPVTIYHFDGTAASLQQNVPWPLADFQWTRLESIWGVTGEFGTTEIYVVGWNATIFRYGPTPP